MMATKVKKKIPEHVKGTRDELLRTVAKGVVAADSNRDVASEKFFGPAIEEFTIKIPKKGFKFDSIVDSFIEEKAKDENSNCVFSDDFVSENFLRTTDKLEGGKTYLVKIFPVISFVSGKDCLRFIEKHNAMLVGGPGLVIVCKLAIGIFPDNKKLVSFDRESSLWKNTNGFKKVPCVYHINDVFDYDFDFSFFDSPFLSNSCLLCVYPI